MKYVTTTNAVIAGIGLLLGFWVAGRYPQVVPSFLKPKA